MVKYEKRNNFVVGLIMEISIIVFYAISIITTAIDISDGNESSYNTTNLYFYIFAIGMSIVAIMVSAKEKWQNGCWVSMTFWLSIAEQIYKAVCSTIFEDPYGLGVNSFESFLFNAIILLIYSVPVVFIILYFAIPNTVLKVLALIFLISFCILELVSIIYNIINAIDLHLFYGSLAFTYIKGLIFDIITATLTIILVCRSFKAVRAPRSVAPVQPMYAQPVVPIREAVPVQPVAPVPPVYNQPVTPVQAVPVQPVYQQFPAPSSKTEIPDDEKIARFHKLYEDGIITQEEFEKKKNEILFGK